MSGPMTEPREAPEPYNAFEQVLLRYADRAHDNDTYRAMVPEVVLRDAAHVLYERRQAAAGVHLGDEGLRAALDAIEHLSRVREGIYPPEGNYRIWMADINRRARAALAAQENPTPVRSTPSLDEGLLALALYEVDGFGLLSECRERARDIASVYRRLAQEGETP